MESFKFRGFSIIELLVVIAVFTILAVLATQSVILTLRGSKKSESLTHVRENIGYAFAIMERHIRYADEIENCGAIKLDYIDSYGNPSYFSCETSGSDSFIASGSATNRLTNPDVIVTCLNIFSCDPGSDGVPPSVTISLTAQDAGSAGAIGAQVTSSTKIFLRSY